MDNHKLTPDLLSIVLMLRPQTGEHLSQEAPRWWGRAAQALLLDVVQRADPQLAQKLHDEQAPNPYTVSSLLGSFPQRRLSAEQTYTLRLTAYQAELSALLWGAAQPGHPLGLGAVIEMDFKPFLVESVHLQAEQHPWASAYGYKDLATESLLGSAPPRRLCLQFTSPTAFHSQEKHIPLPLPELVFGSLLERWNAFAPLAFPAETRRYAAECLAVSRYDLKTRSLPLREGATRIGMVGQASFTTLNYDRYWMSILQTLAAFSLFSGVGVSASMGCGQCRLMKGEE